MNAVILGYGVVGKGIEILTNSLEDINIKYVYVRKEKENLPYFSNNEDMVVQDDIDIVCAFHPQEKLDEILEIQKQIHQKYVGIHATLNVVYLDITVDCTKGSGLKKLCSLLNQEVISYCIGDSYNDLDMFEKADHAYTFNRVEKQIKEKTEKQVDYVYEVINDMLEGE